MGGMADPSKDRGWLDPRDDRDLLRGVAHDEHPDAEKRGRTVVDLFLGFSVREGARKSEFATLEWEYREGWTGRPKRVGCSQCAARAIPRPISLHAVRSSLEIGRGIEAARRPRDSIPHAARK
jgi:hypothetical protein